MSEYTREEILRLIEENGGPEGLDLSGADLSGITLTEMDLHGIILGRWDPQRGKMIAADLSNSNLVKANLSGACLCDVKFLQANLSGANLSKANLVGADLRRSTVINADFSGAKLERWDDEGRKSIAADLSNSNLWVANLSEARLVSVNFSRANLEGADLPGANLARADFTGATLVYADLSGANMPGVKLCGADLRTANLAQVDLRDAESLKDVRLYQVRFDRTRLKRDQLGEAIGDELVNDNYVEAQGAYLALKQNFDDLGDYDAASWAYRKERQMEKATKAPWRCREYYGQEEPFPRSMRWLIKKLWPDLRQCGLLSRWSPLVWWFWIKYSVKWLTDWFVEYLCGYGESIWRVLAWMLLVILGFAAYYQVSHAVVTSSKDAVASLWDHLIFSLGAFTTLQPARLQAARPGVELLTTVQAIIGISLAGLLGFVAGNRIRRS